jgi:hypothetical protein
MGIINVLFPFGSAIKVSEHSGSFLWTNFRNIFGLLSLIAYVVFWILLIVVIAIGVFTIGFGLVFIFVPFLVWLPFDFICLVLGIPATLFHILACKGDEGIASAFTTVGLTVTGVCTLSMYGFILHIVAWITCWFGLGFLIFFVVYLFCTVLLVLAILAAKKEA